MLWGAFSLQSILKILQENVFAGYNEITYHSDMKQSYKLPIVIFLTILIGILIGFFFQSRIKQTIPLQQKTPQETSSPEEPPPASNQITPILEPFNKTIWRCPDLANILQTVSANLPNTRIGRSQIGSQTLLWKVGKSMPFIKYVSDDSADLELKKGDVEKLDDFFNKNSENFINVTFIDPNHLNEKRLSEPDLDIHRQWNVQRGEYLYTLVILPHYYNEPSQLTVNCVENTREKQLLFEKISSVAKFATNWNEATIPTISGEYDHLLAISIHGLDYEGGSVEWWANTDNKWEKLASGQDLPQCKIFEEKRVGRGLPCFGVNGETTVRY